jgi:hypothetical protein
MLLLHSMSNHSQFLNKESPSIPESWGLVVELSEDLGIDKKRKRVKELASLSASAHTNVAGEASALEDEEELFDALDS